MMFLAWPPCMRWDTVPPYACHGLIGCDDIHESGGDERAVIRRARKLTPMIQAGNVNVCVCRISMSTTFITYFFSVWLANFAEIAEDAASSHCC
jgi:hypothetical protein